MILGSFHFPQISFASFHLAECVYSFLLVLAMWWILKISKEEKPWKFFVAGLFLMISFYFKGNHVFFVPIFCLWYLLHNRSHVRKVVINMSALAAGCFLVMLPHLVWTSFAYDKAMAGPSAGALNFIEGKCPSKNNKDSDGMSWMSPLFAQIGETTAKEWERPFTDQAYFWKEGLKCVQENPLVMVSSLRYIYYLFFDNELWPAGFVPSMEHAYYAWKPIFNFLVLPMSLLGFVILSRRKKSEAHWILTLLVLSVFITVYIFKSENRFRVPFDGALIILAGYGLQWMRMKVRSLLRLRILMTKKPRPFEAF